MKRNLGWISVIIFVAAFMLYVLTIFFNQELFPGTVTLSLLILLPIIGLITSVMAHKGTAKVIGLTGNAFVLLIAAVIPFVASLFWNSP